MKRVGLVVKFHQAEASVLAREVGVYLLRRGLTVLFEEESQAVAKSLKRQAEGLTAAQLRKVRVVSKKKLAAESDFIIVLGGDGTYLSIARLMATRSVPLLGINMGQLGFLTEIKRDETFSVLNEIFEKNKIRISERSFLEVNLRRDKKIIYSGVVINDAVISKGAIARIITLQIGINGKWANSVRADGMIVSTPTGSTAYALAAGGPIVEPSMRALLITPICAHSLTQRPLVLSDESEIQIRLMENSGHVVITLDGQDVVDMKEEDVLTVKRHRGKKLKLVSSPSRDFFGLLHEKLKFGLRA